MSNFQKIFKRIIPDSNLIKKPESVEILELDVVKHAETFSKLYPEYIKDSNLAEVSFRDYYSSLVRGIEAKDAFVYAIRERKDNKIIGFIVLEKMYPFIVSAHIVVEASSRNFYNAYKACILLREILLKTDIRQIIAYVRSNNMNVRILLKKLGFLLWGKQENCMAYSIILPARKG